MAQQNLDLLTRLAYLQAGGRDPGQRDIDKINSIFGGVSNVGKTIMDYLATDEALKKSKLEREKAQQEIEANRLSLTPIYKTAGLPSKEEELAKQRQIESQNLQLQKSKEAVYGGLQGIPENLTEEEFRGTTGYGRPEYERFKQQPTQFVSEREQFAKSRNIAPEILDMPVSKAKEYGSVIGTGKVWVNPSNPSQFSETPIAGWYEAKQSQGLAAAAQFAKQDKQQSFAERQQERSQKFQTVLMQMREKMREEADARLLTRQELQQERPKYDDLNKQIKIGNRVKEGLQWAEKNGINITGLLSTPVNKFKERFGLIPEDQQKILTSIRLNFADFVRERGGTAFTTTEKEIFAPIVPEETMDEETNIFRINAMLEIMNDKLKYMTSSYPDLVKTQKKPSESPSTPKAKDKESKMVTVEYDGKEYAIPELKVSEFIKDNKGAKTKGTYGR